MKPRVPWQRLTLSIFAITIMLIVWKWSVNYLYDLPTETIASFTSLTTNMFYVVGAIVIFMISGKLIYDWKIQTAQSIQEKGEQIRQEFVERTPRPRDFDESELP